MVFTKDELTNEEWRDIVGYEGKYQVSNLGRVRSLNWGRQRIIKILLPFISHQGYLCVKLSLQNIKPSKYIHRLVAEAFIPNDRKLPQVNHKDENKSNNCVRNLEWCTAKYNSNYGTIQERRKMTNIVRNTYCAEKAVSQYSMDGVFIQSFKSIATAILTTGIHKIGNAARGQYKTAGGYIWCYANDTKRIQEIENLQEGCLL